LACRRSFSFSRTLWAAVLTVVTLVLAGCASPPPPGTLERLHPCDSTEGLVDAYCGALDVWENRATRTGRRITLNIVVLPALSTDVRPDPLFFLAGGPGQGAAQLAPQIQAMFHRVQRNRDIVLVDQRGTGRSNPLDCASDTEALADLTESDARQLAKLRACLAGLKGDVRLYTTTIAMDDLDDVRAHLGYEHVNLYGGSYGTRAALVYLRQYGPRVRSMVLDGVAPMDMRLPLYTARDAQRALDHLLQDCDADAACRGAFPGLGVRIRALVARLDAEPMRRRIVHPRTGVAEEMLVTGRLVASILFSALYAPLTTSVLPYLVEHAEQGDFEGLLALAFAGETTTDNMSLGMQLSVVCSEDAGRYTPDDLTRETAGTVFGRHLMVGQVEACAFWPKGDVRPDYYAPVVSDVPALVLSGELDPVTPPQWGAAVAKHLSRGKHFTAAGTGHGVIATACGAKLVADFLERGSADQLDARCLQTITRPGFFVTPAGPEPVPARARISEAHAP
jgi:pimeloyl-ACP methyl ester carboxylesterase